MFSTFENQYSHFIFGANHCAGGGSPTAVEVLKCSKSSYFWIAKMSKQNLPAVIGSGNGFPTRVLHHGSQCTPM